MTVVGASFPRRRRRRRTRWSRAVRPARRGSILRAASPVSTLRSLPKMPFFVVTHNVTDSKFYKENVEAMIGSLPNCDPINEGDEGLHKKDLHQLSVNFPSSANGDVKIGWAPASDDLPFIPRAASTPTRRSHDFHAPRAGRRRSRETAESFFPRAADAETNHPRASAA